LEVKLHEQLTGWYEKVTIVDVVETCKEFFTIWNDGYKRLELDKYWSKIFIYYIIFKLTKKFRLLPIFNGNLFLNVTASI